MLLSTPRSWLAGSAYTVPLRYERLITILQEVAYTHATDEHSQGEGIIHVFTDSVFHNPTQYRSYTVENTSLPCLAPPSSNHVYSKTVLIPQLGRLSCPVLSAFCSVHLCIHSQFNRALWIVVNIKRRHGKHTWMQAKWYFPLENPLFKHEFPRLVYTSFEEHINAQLLHNHQTPSTITSHYSNERAYMSADCISQLELYSKITGFI